MTRKLCCNSHVPNGIEIGVSNGAVKSRDTGNVIAAFLRLRTLYGGLDGGGRKPSPVLHRYANFVSGHHPIGVGMAVNKP